MPKFIESYFEHFYTKVSNLKLISVIIPSYNTEKYLSKAIQSVISQSYSYTEIIIVNDGSTDQTPGIAEEYKQKDSRVKLFHQENKGLSAARNSGIRFANGEIIGFLDSDDWWHYQYLEKMVNRLISDKRLGISFSRIQYADEDGNLLPIYTRGHVKNIQRQDFYYMNPLSCGSNIVIKKRFLDEVGFFDESLKSFEDLDFLHRAALHPLFQISGIKDSLVYYRIREGLSHDTARMSKSWNQFMQKVESVNPGDYHKHYLPALLSQNITLARRALHSAQPGSISRYHLLFCLKHPIAFTKLALRYPILAFYTFPKALMQSFLLASMY